MPPAVVGVLFLGDTTRHGLAAVAVLGFILAVVCAVALARFGEASDRGQEFVETREPGRVSQPADRRAALPRHGLPGHP
jgi:hypothetical protein